MSVNFFYVIRYGAMNWVARFCSASKVLCKTGDKIIVKTSRGHEVGEVLIGPTTAAESDFNLGSIPGRPSDNVIRVMTPADHEQLRRSSEHLPPDGLEQCRAMLAKHETPIEIIDIERLFDDSTIVFYYLGEENRATNFTSNELGREWQVNVRFDSIVETIPQGPDCSSGGCDSCGCS